MSRADFPNSTIILTCPCPLILFHIHSCIYKCPNTPAHIGLQDAATTACRVAQLDAGASQCGSGTGIHCLLGLFQEPIQNQDRWNTPKHFAKHRGEHMRKGMSAGMRFNKCFLFRTTFQILFFPIELRSCLRFCCWVYLLQHCRGFNIFVRMHLLLTDSHGPAPTTCSPAIDLKASAAPFLCFSVASTESIFSKCLYFQVDLCWASLMTPFKMQMDEYFWKPFLLIALVSSLLGKGGFYEKTWKAQPEAGSRDQSCPLQSSKPPCFMQNSCCLSFGSFVHVSFRE